MIRTSDAQIRYLSQAVQLEEAVSPAILRTTMLTISITILSFTVWAGFTNINEVARTPGEVVPADTNRSSNIWKAASCVKSTSRKAISSKPAKRLSNSTTQASTKI